MVGFTKSTAKRVLASTRQVERASRSLDLGRRSAIQVESDLYAQITEHLGDGKYAWSAIQWADDSFTSNDDYGTYEEEQENYALEHIKSEHVLIDSLVFLRWIEEGHFAFVYKPDLKYGKTSGEITARSAGVPGTGSVIIDDYSDGSFSSGDTIDVFNGFSSVIETDTIVQLQYGSGVWWITGADCEAS